MTRKKVVLCILDGFGVNESESYGDATKQAHTPFLDYLYAKYPNTLLKAHGEHVGLLKDSMGNSEVGHLTIGAGRVIPQKIAVINEAIENGSFRSKICSILENLSSEISKEHSKTVMLQRDGEICGRAEDDLSHKQMNVHVIGLLSDGGVHSHIDHIKAVIDSIDPKYSIYVHSITDGRDTDPKNCVRYLHDLLEFCDSRKKGVLATICGRFYAMDRDNNYDRIERAIGAILHRKSYYHDTRTANDIPLELPNTENPQNLAVNAVNTSSKHRNPQYDEKHYKELSERHASSSPNVHRILRNAQLESNQSKKPWKLPESSSLSGDSGLRRTELDNDLNVSFPENGSWATSSADAAHKNIQLEKEQGGYSCKHRPSTPTGGSYLIPLLKTLTNEIPVQNHAHKKVVIEQIISAFYEQGYNDENIPPISFGKEYSITDSNVFIFCNFRQDRMRQIVDNISQNFRCITMTRYGDYKNTEFLFDKENLNHTMAEIISKNGLSQTHIAETEKYAHVTYFLNGYRESPFKGEKRIMIHSKKLPSFDHDPEMRTAEICEAVRNEIHLQTGFIVFNIASPDMVGHTGNLEATIRAIEFVDRNMEKVYKSCIENGYTLFITADHGNSEIMIDHNGGRSKKHTTNPVPFIICDTGAEMVLDTSKPTLANILPTILEYLQLEYDQIVHEKSLIRKRS